MPIFTPHLLELAEQLPLIPALPLQELAFAPTLPIADTLVFLTFLAA